MIVEVTPISLCLVLKYVFGFFFLFLVYPSSFWLTVYYQQVNSLPHPWVPPNLDARGCLPHPAERFGPCQYQSSLGEKIDWLQNKKLQLLTGAPGGPVGPGTPLKPGGPLKANSDIAMRLDCAFKTHVVVYCVRVSLFPLTRSPFSPVLPGNPMGPLWP